MGIALQPEARNAVTLVRDALRLSAHVVAIDPTQLAGQLLGRLHAQAAPAVTPLLQEARAHGSGLLPLQPTLTPPGGPLVLTLATNSRDIWWLATLDSRRVVTRAKKEVRVWDVETGECLHALTETSIGTLMALDAGRVASASLDGTLRIWDVETGNCLRTLIGHTGTVTAVAALDGSRVASASRWDRTLRVWDVVTGRCVRTLASPAVEASKRPDLVLRGYNGPTFEALMALGRQLLISGDRSGDLRVWDLETGSCVQTWDACVVDDWLELLVPLDGRRVVSGGDDSQLRLWDVGTNECLRTLSGHTGAVTQVAAVDAERVVSHSYHDRTVRVWDVATGVCLNSVTGRLIGVLAFGGRSVVVVGHSGGFSVWDGRTGEHLFAGGSHREEFIFAAVALDARRLVIGGPTIRVWDVETGACLGVMEGHTEPVTAIVTLDAGRVVSASEDWTLRVWNVEYGKNPTTQRDHPRHPSLSEHPPPAVSSVVPFAPSRVISLASDRTLQVWNIETGRCLLDLYEASTAVALDARRLVSGNRYGTLEVWDLGSGSCLRTLTAHAEEVTGVVALDARRVCSLSSSSWHENGALRVWDIETGTCLHALDGHTDSVSLVMALGDRRVVSGSSDKTLRVWDVETGTCLRILRGHTDGVEAVVALDGRHVVSACGRFWDLDSEDEESEDEESEDEESEHEKDTTLRVWDVETGKCLRILRGHTDVIEAVVALDARLVVSASADGTLRVWDLNTGNCFRTLEVGRVTAVVALDARRVVSGDCWDGTLRIWDVVTGKCETTFTPDFAPAALCTLPSDGASLSRGPLRGRSGRELDIVCGDEHGYVHFLRWRGPQ